MDERLMDTGREFEEMNQKEKTDFLNDYQEQLAEKNDEKLGEQISFLGSTGDTKAMKDAKKYVNWAADNGFTGYHAIQAKHQWDRAVKAKEEAEKITGK